MINCVNINEWTQYILNLTTCFLSELDICYEKKNYILQIQIHCIWLHTANCADTMSTAEGDTKSILTHISLIETLASHNGIGTIEADSNSTIRLPCGGAVVVVAACWLGGQAVPSLAAEMGDVAPNKSGEIKMVNHNII